MSSEKLSTFESTLKKSYEWVDAMQAEMGASIDRQDAYHALRAGLHFLRDRLPPNEVAHLSAQLPMLIRGIYYEGWNPSDKPLPINEYDEMAEYLADAIDRDISSEPTVILKALFSVLHTHISEGELQDIQSMLPAETRVFWPNLVS